jgi:hypothetical protein
VTYITEIARNALHGHEYMRQHDVGRRLGRVRTLQVCTNLVCCILHALPKLLSGVNNVGVNRIFHGIPQIKVYRIEVW